MLCVTALAYIPTTISLLSMWNTFGSRYYTHGDLVLCLAGWTWWRRHEQLRRAPVAPNRAGAIGLLALSGAWLIAHLSTIQAAQQMLYPVVLWFAIFAVLGASTARLCLFPLGFLYFGIPIWDFLNGPLQKLTLTATAALLRLTGLPAVILGTLVHVPAGNFDIAGGCSGLFYLVVALAVAVYYGELFNVELRWRAALIAAAGALAIVGNWLRVLTLIWVGQLTHMQSYLVRVSHDEFGWALFAVLMLALLVSAERWIPRSHRSAADPTMCTTASGAPASPPSAASHAHRSAASRGWTVVSLAFLISGPAFAAYVASRPTPLVTAHPLESGRHDWRGPEAGINFWHPVFAGADVAEIGTYRQNGAELQVFVAEYSTQSQSAKLHGAGNSVLGTTMIAIASASAPSKPGTVAFSEIQARDAMGATWLVWVTYQIGDQSSQSVIRAQLLYSLQSLALAPLSRVVAVRARCAPDCVLAQATVLRFLSDNPWLFPGVGIGLPPRRL